MAFKDGDFLEIEYNAWNAVDNSLVLSTDAARAKEAGIYNDKAKYGPVLIVLGSKSTIRGLDRELRNMSVGEVKKFTFKPEDAFGERSESLVRIVPLSDFRKRDINPYPGMSVDIDNVPAVVKSVNSGRVVVDANHPYAGRELIYEVKVVRQLSTLEDKIGGFAKTYDMAPSRIEVEGGTARIRFGKEVNKDANYFVDKASLIASIFTYIDGIGTVEVEEEYAKPEQEKPADKEMGPEASDNKEEG
ncbi:MAG: FKBP-type peptidyl-prolyl cis-trans isomerase [Candidatus Micrarchaeia archaeon]